MEKDWVIIYSSADSYKVNLLKTLLDREEIPNVIMNHQDSFYKFGSLELYVNRDDAMKAKRIINENDNE
ncbi:MAG TPA: DUF2007 domain-containing protein [Bacteroidia bacterium]|nr:DUF2007 domain-containing protein [Bacteroidia bacterium]